LQGPGVLGFLACGAAVRREAFLEVGGFEGHYGLGGEEELLALDLAVAGWNLVYDEAATAYHHPEGSCPRRGRRRLQARNALWSIWLRRPLGSVIARTARSVSAAIGDPDFFPALCDALKGLPWVVRNRRVVPPEIERWLRQLGR
jgi:GT2 family glycosyltransferase